MYLTHDERDALIAHLDRHSRRDLLRHLPGSRTTHLDFWRDVLARFNRDEWADAITAIEREFEPRGKKPGDATIMLLASARKVPA